jgi:tetratricopeptide (TPR) repeat protein
MSALESAMRLFRDNRLDEAGQELASLLAAEPDNGEALQGLGYIAARQGRHGEAAELLERAASTLPPALELSHHAGIVNQRAGRYEQARRHLETCLRLAPAHLPSHVALAEVQIAQGQHAAALATVEKTLALAPEAAALHYNRGSILGALGRYEDELAAYRRAIARKPDFTDAHVNLGAALRDLRRFDEALAAFRKAIAIDPDHAGARTNRAQTNLLLGEFEHGWREYEWRWRDGRQNHGYAARPWLGANSIAGKTLLVHAEQGLGDTLQFVRYAKLVSGLGATVILRVQDSLLELLRGTPGMPQTIGETQALPPYDHHIPLLSLPHALYRAHPGIPRAPSYLQADPARIARWAAWLEERGAGKRLKVGLAWSGSRAHLDDHNRSAPLSAWQPLLAQDALFVSLQKDVRASDGECLASQVQAGRLFDAGPDLGSFADTAGLVANLDLVISVDTSVAHLAGALGTPVWIALPYTPDWRWQLERADSPWYPGARLFRQARRGVWDEAVAALAAALAEQ